MPKFLQQVAQLVWPPCFWPLSTACRTESAGKIGRRGQGYRFCQYCAWRCLSGIAQTVRRRKKPGFLGEAGLLMEVTTGIHDGKPWGRGAGPRPVLLVSLVTVVGCYRTRYRLAADRDATAILAGEVRLPAVAVAADVLRLPRSAFAIFRSHAQRRSRCCPCPPHSCMRTRCRTLPQRDPARFGRDSAETLAAGPAPSRPPTRLTHKGQASS